MNKTIIGSGILVLGLSTIVGVVGFTNFKQGAQTQEMLLHTQMQVQKLEKEVKPSVSPSATPSATPTVTPAKAVIYKSVTVPVKK